ncbi:uncharacterized protein GBIM_01000 [Gryllus bimaculatus]|nr:uncharacterized protein GBIM_01000 [Gryllus bimaculatus]
MYNGHNFIKITFDYQVHLIYIVLIVSNPKEVSIFVQYRKLFRRVLSCGAPVAEHHGLVPPRFSDRVASGPVREGETAVLSCVSQGHPPPNYCAIGWQQRPPDGPAARAWARAWAAAALATAAGAAPRGPWARVPQRARCNMRHGVLVVRTRQLRDAGRYVSRQHTGGSERVELELAVWRSLAVHVAAAAHVDLGRRPSSRGSVAALPRPRSPGQGRPALAARLSTILCDEQEPDCYWEVSKASERVCSFVLGQSVRIGGPGGARLHISAVSREDRGMYQCFAKNDYEMVQGTTELRLGELSNPMEHFFVTRRYLQHSVSEPPHQQTLVAAARDTPAAWAAVASGAAVAAGTGRLILKQRQTLAWEAAWLILKEIKTAKNKIQCHFPKHGRSAVPLNACQNVVEKISSWLHKMFLRKINLSFGDLFFNEAQKLNVLFTPFSTFLNKKNFHEEKKLY